jgi:hypothetical protein
MFHATRLLPHEHEAIRQEGLVVLTEDHRSQRLDRIVQMYGPEIGTEALERLRTAGPLAWSEHHRHGRLGVIFGVTPLQASFDGAGRGMTVFLSHWGGESFYWAGEDSPDLERTIDRLTKRSTPAIVEFGVHAHSLNRSSHLWSIFVAQLDGWSDGFHEFWIRESIPPAHVCDILGPASDRWPISFDAR